MATTLSSIPKTIANVCITMLQTIVYYTKMAIADGLYELSYIIDVPTFFAIAIIMVARKYRLLDTVIVALLIAMMAHSIKR